MSSRSEAEPLDSCHRDTLLAALIEQREAKRREG